MQVIGTFLKHSPKAIGRGHPADSIFAVVGVRIVGVGVGVEVAAWKCARQENALLHPAHGSVAFDDPEFEKKVFTQRGESGILPTAVFTPDGLYVRCDARGNTINPQAHGD